MVQQSQVLQQLNGLNSSGSGGGGGSHGAGSAIASQDSSPGAKSSAKPGRQQLQLQLQQLALQQHQIMQQLQISHRQYLLGLPPFLLPQALNADLQGLWKDGVTSALEDGGGPLKGLNGLLSSASGQPPTLTAGVLPPCSSSSSRAVNGSTVLQSALQGLSSHSHSLYGHGVCKWPGCDAECEDYQAFVKHLNMEHQLDDRSTAQARVQMQVVSQLELQLDKERDRLQSMMAHLHMKPPNGSSSGSSGKDLLLSSTHKPATSSPQALPVMSISPPPLTMTTAASPLMTSRLLGLPSSTQATSAGPIRRRLSDKGVSPLSVASLPDSPIRRRVAERANLDITEEIQRNREFYKSADVRPPFTYASLIRQNAIRTNLSLHKCFVRYEDDYGSFWMVDDREFVKRRHLSRGRPRKFADFQNLPSQLADEPTHPTDQDLRHPSQAALAESNLSFLSAAISGTAVSTAASIAGVPNVMPGPRPSSVGNGPLSGALVLPPVAGADNAAERFVAGMLGQGFPGERLPSNGVHIKQEPEVEEPSSDLEEQMETSDQLVTASMVEEADGSEEPRPSEGPSLESIPQDGADREDEEEAEDLSLSSSTTTPCETPVSNST
ncbi:forkhead domain-containing protein, putative [Ixodes scapularis]|uniref:Forkhead domain-containing protein, putative n=1 Tax=Ixodes scapularis TaxID=6945 RepID=B7QJZ4_IXOSC|nr:forkhead domain-containing protein, putative [Ixodes scapularis]|eukprot:XP_002415501.1 forkhead domain-containing protein, putative [Ixodes scapularis]